MLDAGEHQIAGSGEGRRSLEQLGVMALDPPQAGDQLPFKVFRLAVTEKGGEPFETLVVGRQGVGLLVVDHLQAVFDGAQEPVVRDELVGHLGPYAAGRGQGAHRIAGAGDAQARIAPAPDELLGLDEQLDCADAAGAQFYVVAGPGDLAAAAMGVDLALDRMDVLDRREVQVLAPQKGLQAVEEVRPGGRVAGHRPGLDHRRALPVLAGGLIIGLGGQYREGERGQSGIGTQPQIGAKDVALRGALLHRADQVAGETDEALLQAVGIGGLDPFLVVEHDQIDVAGVVEFVPAELAHAEDDEARAVPGPRRVG